MKARNREINIFNMSLLDILCGALGTFCFLMLVLFPYYTTDPSKSKAPEVPPGVDPKTYEEAMARIKELEEALRKFQDYSKQLEGQVSQAQAQVKQLQDQLAKAQDKVDQLEFRNPFLVTMAAFGMSKDDDYEIYINDKRITTDKKKTTPPPDPDHRQGAFWTGDLAFSHADLDFGYFMVRDGPPGDYSIYLKVLKHNPAGPPVDFGVIVEGVGFHKVSPDVWIAKEKIMIPVGVVKIARDYTQTVEFTIPKELTVRPATNPPQEPVKPQDQKPPPEDKKQ